MNARIVSIVSVCLLLSVPAWPGNKSAKDAAARAQALALFQKALSVSDIRAPGSPPFELEATIDVHGGGKKDESGTYDLKWVSPEEWREEIRFTDYWQTRVGGKDQFWQARGGHFQFGPMTRLRSALDYLQVLRYWAKPASMADVGEVKIQSRRMEGDKTSCVTLITKGFRSGREYCFDAEKGTFLGYGNKTSTFSQFITFAGKELPGRIHAGEFLKQTIEFSAPLISPLTNPDASQFQPLENAQVWPSCYSPDTRARIIRQVMPTYPGVARDAEMGGTVWFYAVIGTDGHVHDLTEIGSASTVLATSAAAAMAQWEYSPEMCNGRPVLVETMLEAIFNLN